MINVGEVITDPDFARSFVVKRPRGSFGNEGVYSQLYTELSMIGIVQPASERELALLPEGTRLSDVIAVWSNLELRVADGAKVESDIIVVDTKRYRVIKSEPWPDAGYWKVLAEGYVT